MHSADGVPIYLYPLLCSQLLQPAGALAALMLTCSQQFGASSYKM